MTSVGEPNPVMNKTEKIPSQSNQVVCSAVLAVCGMDSHELEPWSEPPPMLVDMSVVMQIEKTLLPC